MNYRKRKLKDSCFIEPGPEIQCVSISQNKITILVYLPEKELEKALIFDKKILRTEAFIRFYKKIIIYNIY